MTVVKISTVLPYYNGGTEMTDQAKAAEKAEKLPKGEAKRRLDAFCDAFVVEHGRCPLHKEVLAGTKLAAMTMAKPWKEWNEVYAAKKSGTPAVQPAGPVEAVAVPDCIASAWSQAIGAIQAEALQELEANKLAIRRELDQSLATNVALEEEKALIVEDGERVQAELEQAELDAAATVEAAEATIAARDAVIAGLQADLSAAKGEAAVQAVELAGVRVALGKAEHALAIAQDGERAAHAAKESTLELLATEQVKSARLADEATAANTARTVAETESKASALALQGAQTKLIEIEISLAAAKTEAAERLAQIQAAEARFNEARQHGEDLAREAREHGEEVAAGLRKEVVQLQIDLAAAQPAKPADKD